MLKIAIQEWIKFSLKKQKINKFTEIQSLTLPITLKNNNVIGISPTGTGKTLAFIIPILNKLDFKLAIQSIIICPTRELARQIFSKIFIFAKDNPKLKIGLWIGGEEIHRQINSIKNNPQIIVATPTRFLEIIKHQPTINFKNLKTIVLDEADMLFDLGFSDEILKIFELFKNISNIQKLAFSATINDLLTNQLAIYFKNTKIISTKDSLINDNIKHYLIKNKDKYHALSIILNQINPYFCLIYTNTKNEADSLYKYLLNQNRNVINLHGGLRTRERKNNYKNIKNLKYQYAVVTDLASRGLDIEGASHVISWDLPNDYVWYIHRAGRCGRNKYQGNSYVLYDCNNNSNEKIINIQKKGIKFIPLKIKNNQLVKSQIKLYKKPIINYEQEQEIKQLVLKNKKDIKPGYKKRLKKDIIKIKQKHKHKHIEKLIKEQKIKRYKQEIINLKKN